MPIAIRCFITIACYGLLFIGLFWDDTWLIVAGAFLAGSTTTKLIFELLTEKTIKNLVRHKN